MKKVHYLSILIVFFCSTNVVGQITEIHSSDSSISEVTGRVFSAILLDKETSKALPYANIHIKHTTIGTVSNEKGDFSIDISNVNNTDTLCFNYIGYSTKCIPISMLDTITLIYLKEEIFNLNETVIFGSTPNPVAIIKRIIKNKDSNYRKTTSKRQTFIRERYNSDIDNIDLAYKKSSIDELDEEIIEMLEDKLPKHSTSYSDFLGNLYTSNVEDDSIKFKIDPIRAVALKEKDIAELEQMEKIFEDVFAFSNDEEYWKIKTGIFSQKLDIENDTASSENDTIVENDSINDSERKMKYFQKRTAYKFRYSSLDNKNEWEFLYSTGKYNYTLVGGTRVNGEDVYIIDFTPKSGGSYKGRVFVSISTSALIRADYEYAEDKTGRDIHLFGVGYTENAFSGSIYFEKKDDNYLLKYYSKQAGTYASFDRNIALVKKRKRFLFDKKLKEIKVGIDLSLISESSIEFLILNEEEITHDQFIDYEQPETFEVIYVDQFDDKLWQGYSIIEPTKQMKDYKKQKGVFNE